MRICFGNEIKITKTTFPRLYSRTCFCYDYKILKNNNILLESQTFLCKVCEIFLTWFSLVTVLQKRCEYEQKSFSSLSKQKPGH